MNEIDYEELIRSPLDDLESKAASGWVPVIAGVLAGAVAALLLSLVVGGTEVAPEEDAVVTSTTAAIAAAPTVASDYPIGYTEIAPGLAANSGEIIIADDVVSVAFTTAAIRGSDPLQTRWPIGGSWLLESGSGAVAESVRVVVGRFSPGAFTVHFPAEPFNGATDFASARMIERWDQDSFSGSVTVPFSGEPFAAPDPVTIPITQDMTLLIPDLRLGRFRGSVEWATRGTPHGATINIAVTLRDAAGEFIGSYVHFPAILDPSDGGELEILWDQSFPTDQEGAVTAVIEYTVSVPEIVPVSTGFDLTGTPIGR